MKKYGKKSIVLVGPTGPIFKCNYKRIRSALRRAVEISYDNRTFVQIWHNEHGKELATIMYNKYRGTSIQYTKHFHRMWS